MIDNYDHLIGKKLLILGGNPETAELVKKANEIGVFTIVADPNHNAPAKTFSNKHYEIDGFDIPKLVQMARNESVDGVLVGVADILVQPYLQLCEVLNLPCYATREIIDSLTSKDGFDKAIKFYNIDGIPSYYLGDNFNSCDLNNIQYPVIVKPVDSGGGVGICICKNEKELINSANIALSISKKGAFLTEKYMNCDDILAYYTFKNGEILLSAIADRITTKRQGASSPVCIAALYPSKYTEQFYNFIHPKMVEMFKGLKIKDGILSIQFFVDGGKFFAYDPGFRLQGEAPHIYINYINGFDHRLMLINYSLTGDMGIDKIINKNDFMFRGKQACTLWVLLKKGIIKEIKGIEELSDNSNVVHILQRMFEGDVISESMVGNEKQVLARIYLVSNTKEELVLKIQSIESLLSVIDEKGDEMIVELFNPQSIVFD